MNNLHRELAPISDAAWAQIEEEAIAHAQALPRRAARRRRARGRRRRPFRRRHRPSARHRGARGRASSPDSARSRRWSKLRVPFELDRQAIDDVERGANDSDWQPARTPRGRWPLPRIARSSRAMPPPASRASARAPAIRAMTLPADVRDYPGRHRPGVEPAAAGRRQRSLSRCCSAPTPTPRSAETSDHGYPVLEHIRRLVERRDHLGPGHRRRIRAHHPRRRFRPAHRPGRLDRLPEPTDRPCACTCRRRSPSCCSPAEAAVALAPTAETP